MKICIPTQSDTFADSRISPHFGKAQYHLVVEDLLEVARHNRDDRPSGDCAPIDWILRQGVTHVACLGIGDGAYQCLRPGGVTVLDAGRYRWIRDALRAAHAGELTPFDPARLCDHHHHHHSNGTK